MRTNRDRNQRVEIAKQVLQTSQKKKRKGHRQKGQKIGFQKAPHRTLETLELASPGWKGRKTGHGNTRGGNVACPKIAHISTTHNGEDAIAVQLVQKKKKNNRGKDREGKRPGLSKEGVLTTCGCRTPRGS